MGKTLICSTTLVFLVCIVYVCGYSLASSKDEYHMQNPGMINWYEIYRNPVSQEGKAFSTEHKDVDSNMDGFKLESKEPNDHSTIQKSRLKLQESMEVLQSESRQANYHFTKQSNDEPRLQDKRKLINMLGRIIDLHTKIESNLTSNKFGDDFFDCTATYYDCMMNDTTSAWDCTIDYWDCVVNGYSDYITLQSNDEIQLEDKPILMNSMGDKIDLDNKIDSNLASQIQAGGDWKSMSMSIFCKTSGSKNLKAYNVISALISAYPTNDWVVLVIQGGGWAYSYKGWDGLRKDNLCGPYDFLVFGRPRKYCSKSTDAASQLLQHGALVDGKTAAQVRDLMIQRQGTYDLSYDFISVFQSAYGIGWFRYGYSQCVDDQKRNGYVTLWSGSATD